MCLLKKNIIMSKLDEKVILYKKFMDAKGLPSNIILLTAITKGLVPSIYKKDAKTVSGSNANELSTVKNNFLIKKLGLLDTDELNTGIEEVMKRIGVTERKKYRAVVYYLLAERFNKTSIYSQ